MSKKNRRVSEREKALSEAIALLERQFGKGVVVRLGGTAVDRPPVFSTGALSLDVATGLGGLPKGRIVEVYGPESAGKTTLCLEMVAQVQGLGGTAAYVDAEHSLDVRYAQRLGVDVAQLLLSQPDHGEQALEIVGALAKTGAVDLVVVDSVAALVPRAELEGDMGDAHVGLQARLMSQAMRKIVANCHRLGCTVVFVNQLRTKIGVMFGSPEVTPGGQALKYYASIRLDVRSISSRKAAKDSGSNRVRVKVVKNKLAPPYGEAEFEIAFGQGIDKTLDILETAERLGVVTRNGNWYSFQDQQLGQGREQAVRALAESEDLAAAIKQSVLGLSLGTVQRAA